MNRAALRVPGHPHIAQQCIGIVLCKRSFRKRTLCKKCLCEKAFSGVIDIGGHYHKNMGLHAPHLSHRLQSENFLQHHCRHHIALQFDLAGHEGHLRIHLFVHDFDEIVE